MKTCYNVSVFVSSVLTVNPGTHVLTVLRFFIVFKVALIKCRADMFPKDFGFMDTVEVANLMKSFGSTVLAT